MELEISGAGKIWSYTVWELDICENRHNLEIHTKLELQAVRATHIWTYICSELETFGVTHIWKLKDFESEEIWSYI